MIAFSDLVVGSKAISEQAAAAFARELFAHRQTILREIPDTVLDLAAKIRDTANEDLVPIEKEIEHIVRETLDKYEEGAIEDGALTALGMAIEQFRTAAASRNVS